MTRKCTPLVLNAIKTAYKLTLTDIGGLEAAATCTRVGRGQLSDYGNIQSDKVAPLDVAIDLDLIGQNFHILKAFNLACGFEAMPLDARPSHVLIKCLRRVQEDNGRLIDDTLALLSGNRSISARQDVIRDLTDVVHAAREALQVLAAMGDGE